MKTYLTIWFSSEGESPQKVIASLQKLGFEPVYGNYDMVYNWDKKASLEDIIKLADLVKKTLAGTGVLFKIETL